MQKRLKVLFLANRIPYPPFRGDKLKIFNLSSRLREENDLVLITFVQNKKEFEFREELEKIFKEVHLIYLPKWKSWLNCFIALFKFGSKALPFQVAYFYDKAMKTKVKNYIEKRDLDVVHVQHMRMAQYLSEDESVPRILDLPDAYSLYWERRKTVDRPIYNRLFDAIESKRVIRYESVTTQFDLNLACSVEDKGHLEKIHPKAKFGLLRNGVNLEMFKYQGHDYSRARTLLFTGNMDYAPNVDAVTHFVQNIFPKILESFPSTRLVIAGQRPVKVVRELAAENIEITGFVPDLSEMYSAADILIAPLRFGAGTQNKVLEALAMGLPCICTHIGFEGLEIESGHGAFLAKDDEDFAEITKKLLDSAEMRESCGQKGLEIARKRFSWDIVAQDLQKYLRETANSRTGSTSN